MAHMDDMAELGSTYAKLLVFLDAAHANAHHLGETEMARELSMMLTAVGTRLDQLTSIKGWDMLDDGE
jgi:cephalosporin hydroxylase